MPNDWLYPLSSKSGYCFDLPRGGRTVNTGPLAFEEMINAGGSDHEWGAFHNWRNIEKRDRIWIYYGSADGDLGVVGLAHVRRIEKPSRAGERAPLFLDFDFDQTRQLLRHPYSADRVRRHVPRPMTTVWAVPPKLASELMTHTKKVKTSRPLDTKDRPAVSTITYRSPARNVKVRRRHDSLIHPLEVRLSAVGWRTIDFDVRPKRVDLAVQREGQLILVEAKTFNNSSSQETRDAFAQLAEYRWRFQKRHPSSKLKITPLALFEKEPTSEDVTFLEDHGILVVWASKKQQRMIFGQNSARNKLLVELGC